jgi:hypothetical protein
MKNKNFPYDDPVSNTKWTPQHTHKSKALSLEKYYSKYAEKLSKAHIQLVESRVHHLVRHGSRSIFIGYTSKKSPSL